MENYQNDIHLVTARQNKKSCHDNRYTTVRMQKECLKARAQGDWKPMTALD